TYDRMLAFEPDPANYDVCLKRVPKQEPTADAKITLDPRAVSDRNGHGAFLASGLLAARLIDAPSFRHPDLRMVDTCTLDTVHEGMFGWSEAETPRTMIKLHVEGAEPAALKGAEKLIRRTQA